MSLSLLLRHPATTGSAPRPKHAVTMPTKGISMPYSITTMSPWQIQHLLSLPAQLSLAWTRQALSLMFRRPFLVMHSPSRNQTLCSLEALVKLLGSFSGTSMGLPSMSTGRSRLWNTSRRGTRRIPRAWRCCNFQLPTW